MTVPNRSITIKNGGNGVSPGTTKRPRAVIGIASIGAIATVTPCTSPNQVSDAFGIGTGVDAAKVDLESAGGIVLFVRAQNSVAGAITTGAAYIQTTATGTVAATGTPNNAYQITVEIVTSGTVGVGTFKYALDDGPGDDDLNWSLPIQIPSGTTYEIPNTGITLTFTAGAGAVYFYAGDRYTFSTTAPAFQSADLVAALDALFAYTGDWEFVHVAGEITAAIATTVDTKFAALHVNHKSRFAVLEAVDVDPIGTIAKSGTTPPTITVTGIPRDHWNCQIDIQTGGTVLTSCNFKYSTDGGNTWSASMTCGTTVTLGDTGMVAGFPSGTTYNADNLYTFGTWDKNETAWMTALQTAYAAWSSDWVAVCAGFCELSLQDGKIARRPIAWSYSPLLNLISISTDPGQVLDAGKLPGVSYISHDEAVTPGLDDSRFTTSRTWDKFAGYYVNQGRMGAAAGSDYDLVQYRRTMNTALEALDMGLALEVNRKLRVNKTTGYIDEIEARGIDQKLDARVRAAVVTEGHATDVTISVHRNDNILSTRKLNVDMQVIGVAYAKTIDATAGYLNPALAAAKV